MSAASWWILLVVLAVTAGYLEWRWWHRRDDDGDL